MKILREHFIPLLIIFLLGLTPLLWFKNGYSIAGHDSGLAYDAVIHFEDRLFTWTERYGLGSDQGFAVGGFFIHGLEALIQSFGFSMADTQKLFFIFWFIMPGLAFYFLGNTISSERKYRYAWLIGSVFYMFNHFLMQAWFVAERTKFSIYIAVPIILAILFRYEMRKIQLFPAVAFISLTILFLNGGGFIPLYGSLFVSWLSAFCYFFILNPKWKTFERWSLISILSVVVGLLLNAFWFIPYARDSITAYADTLENVGGIEGIQGWVDIISRNASYDNLLRLQGIQEWYVNPLHPYASSFLNNPVFILMSFLIPGLVAWSLFNVNGKEKKYIIFFGFLAIISMIFTAGSQPPFGRLYVLLVEYVPGFAIFRTPFYKFAGSLWLSFALLFGFAANSVILSLLEKHKYFVRLEALSINNPLISITRHLRRFFSVMPYQKRYLLSVVLVISFIILYNFPFLDGRFFDYEKGVKSTRVKVPDYVFSFNEKIRSVVDSSDRVLLLPEHSEGLNLDAFNWKYWSLAPIQSLISNSSFVSNSSQMLPKEHALLLDLYTALRNNDHNWKKIAAMLSIDGVVIRNDFDWQQKGYETTSPDKYREIISSDSASILKLKEGEWEYYELTDIKKPQIYAPKKTLIVDGSTKTYTQLLDLPIFTKDTAVLFRNDLRGVSDSTLESLGNKKYISVGFCAGCNLRKHDVYLPGVDFFGAGSRVFRLTKWWEKKKLNDIEHIADKIDFQKGTTYKRFTGLRTTYIQNASLSTKLIIMGELKENILRLTELVDQTRNNRDDKTNLALIILHDELKSLLNYIYDLFPQVSDEEEERLITDILRSVEDLITKTKDTSWRTSDEINKKYTFSITEPGDYQMYVASASANLTQSLPQKTIFTIQINDVESSPTAQLEESKKWFYSEPIHLEKGDHTLRFQDGKAENKFNDAIVFRTSGVTIETNTATIHSSSQGEEQCFSVPFPEGNGKTTYRLDFQYKRISGKQDIVTYISDSKELKSSLSRRGTDRLTTNSEYQYYSRDVEPSNGQVLYAHICNVAKLYTGMPSINELQNIYMRKISEPVIIFVKNDSTQDTVMSDITSFKLNPVLHSLQSESQIPQLVIFSDRYNDGWKIIDRKDNKVFSFFDFLLSSYKISEDVITVKSNGIQNGWILPAGKRDFLLLYQPQTLFYQSSAVSSVTFLIIIILVLYYYKRKK